MNKSILFFFFFTDAAAHTIGALVIFRIGITIVAIRPVSFLSVAAFTSPVSARCSMALILCHTGITVQNPLVAQILAYLFIMPVVIIINI